MQDLSMMVGETKFNYRAGLLIEKDDKVLVECNPDLDFVTLPGGKVHTLESSVNALKRELSEEMNIKLDINKLEMKAVIENFFEMDGKKYHELYFLYKLNVMDNTFDNVSKNRDSKANYYKWVNKDELDKVNLLPVVLRKLALSNKFENIVVNDLKND